MKNMFVVFWFFSAPGSVNVNQCPGIENKKKCHNFFFSLYRLKLLRINIV